MDESGTSERFMLKGAVNSKVKAAVAFPLKNIAALIFKHFADCNLRSCVREFDASCGFCDYKDRCMHVGSVIVCGLLLSPALILVSSRLLHTSNDSAFLFEHGKRVYFHILPYISNLPGVFLVVKLD